MLDLSNDVLAAANAAKVVFVLARVAEGMAKHGSQVNSESLQDHPRNYRMSHLI